MATNTSNSSIFNPDVPDTNDPNYLNLSRPISNLRNYGSALGESLTGYGALAGDVVKVAHELTEENLNDKTIAGVDKIRDQRTADLATTLNYVQGGGKVPLSDPGKATSLLSQPDADSQAEAPKPLQERLQTAQVLDSARQNGKLSPTDYIARLDSLAKDLRSQYPGWREHIDEKIKEQTGMNPANALITSMTADINTWAENKKSFSDKITTEMLKHNGEPNAPAYITMRQNGSLSDEAALKWLNGVNFNKTALDHAKTDWEFTKGSLEDRKVLAGVFADQQINQLVTDTMASVMAPYGNDPTKVTEALKNAPPDVVLNFKKDLDTKMTQVQLIARNKLSIPSQSDPNRSPILDLGEDEFQKRLDNKLSVYKAWSGALGDKDMNLANFYEKLNKANSDLRTNDLLKTDMGNVLGNAKVVSDLLGPAAASVLLPTLLPTDLPDQFAAYVAAKKTQRAAGTADPVTGTVPTLHDSIADGYTKVMADTSIDANEKNKRVAVIANNYINQIEQIADKKTPDALKRRYIADAFSPAGLGLLNKMEIDGVGPNGTKGRYSVYSRLLSPEMTDAVKKLGGHEWGMYQDWAQSTISNELLKPEIMKLNDLQRDPNIRLSWDNVNHRFKSDYVQQANTGTGFTGASGREYTKNSTEAFIMRLNTALDKYSYVATKNGEDPNAKILGTLVKLNFDPTISRPAGINQQMIDAMVATSEANRKRQQEIEQKYKKTY